jgi:hypothetical protein
LIACQQNFSLLCHQHTVLFLRYPLITRYVINCFMMLGSPTIKTLDLQVV